jgi:hypothetical protein
MGIKDTEVGVLGELARMVAVSMRASFSYWRESGLDDSLF